MIGPAHDREAAGSEAADLGAASAGPGPSVLVLGIGNILWADEGFGVRCIEALTARWRFGPNVELLDGGTQGLYLIDRVRAADVLVLFDAVDYGLAPGSLRLVEGAEVPRFLGAKKMSLHQTGFQEVLALADLYGDLPRHLLLIGVQPQELDDYGGSLRPAIKTMIEPAIEAALDYLARLDIQAEPATPDSIAAARRQAHAPLELDAYEAGRTDSGSSRGLGQRATWQSSR